MLISQPGGDYQIVSISLDAGYTRDLILMLTDVHAVLDHLYLDGTQPQITSPAEDYLRESSSPYTLPALLDALGEVTGQLSRAERRALGGISPDRPHANQPAAIPPPTRRRKNSRRTLFHDQSSGITRGSPSGPPVRPAQNQRCRVGRAVRRRTG